MDPSVSEWFHEAAQLGAPFDTLFYYVADETHGKRQQLIMLRMLRQGLEKGTVDVSARPLKECKDMLRNLSLVFLSLPPKPPVPTESIEEALAKAGLPADLPVSCAVSRYDEWGSSDSE